MFDGTVNWRDTEFKQTQWQDMDSLAKELGKQMDEMIRRQLLFGSWESPKPESSFKMQYHDLHTRNKRGKV